MSARKGRHAGYANAPETVAAVTVNLIGPETRGVALDEIAPPEG